MTTFTMADWDNSGGLEMLATDSTGTMYLYRADGRGNFRSEVRPQAGYGWKVRAIRSAAGFDGAGTHGLTVTFPNGRLAYYPLAGNHWGGIRAIGSGWGSLQVLAR